MTGLDFKEEVKILNPYNDLNRFYTVDLQKSHSRNYDDGHTLRRQKT